MSSNGSDQQTPDRNSRAEKTLTTKGEELIERLRRASVQASDIQKRMAQDKSLRNSDGKSDALYMWPTPEQTLEGQAADALQALIGEENKELEAERCTATDNAARREPISRLAVEQAARCGGPAETIIADLLNTLDRADDKTERMRQSAVRHKARAEAAEQQVIALREALQPFADIGANISSFWDGERRMATLNSAVPLVRHYRRAVALCALPTLPVDISGDRDGENNK